MIVVEGADNAGKSTLIQALLTVLPGWAVQGSEGPPKYPGEMNERVRSYLGRDRRVVYDRHPCVSQPIYGQMRSHKDDIDPLLIKAFYDQRPLFIYCHGRNMVGHQFNEGTDSAEHLAAVENSYAILLDGYTQWAAQHAFLSYRIGDSVSRLVKTVEFLLNSNKV